MEGSNSLFPAPVEVIIGVAEPPESLTQEGTIGSAFSSDKRVILSLASIAPGEGTTGEQKEFFNRISTSKKPSFLIPAAKPAD